MAVTLLFDADCSFCTRSIHLRVAHGATSTCTPLQEVDLPGHGVDPQRALREMPALLADGRVVYGAQAFRAALSSGTRWMRLLAIPTGVWPISALAQALYSWVAAHRQHLPGGTNSCQTPPEGSYN